MRVKKMGPWIEYAPEDIEHQNPIVSGHVVRKLYRVADRVYRWELFVVREGRPAKCLRKAVARSQAAAEDASQDFYKTGDFSHIT